MSTPPTRDPRVVLSSITLGFIVVLCVGAPWLAPFDPTLTSDTLLSGPTWTHGLGTDRDGRDLWSRTLYGGRISLLVGLATAALTSVLGTAVGLLAAIGPRWLDKLLTSIIDLTLAIPGLVLLLVLMGQFHPQGFTAVFTIVTVLAGLSWPNTARLVRAEALGVRPRGFVRAAEAMGYPRWRTTLHHVLPHSLGPVMVTLPMSVGGAMLAEASLSFLGLGLSPPTVSWGGLVYAGRPHLSTVPAQALAPALAIALCVWSLHLLGEAAGDRIGTGARQQR